MRIAKKISTYVNYVQRESLARVRKDARDSTTGDRIGARRFSRPTNTKGNTQRYTNHHRQCASRRFSTQLEDLRVNIHALDNAARSPEREETSDDDYK